MDPPEFIDGLPTRSEPDHELERVNNELARAWDSSLRERALRARSESIASMVAGIAHDVNTPLGVARTAGSVIDEGIRELLSDSLKDAEDIEEIRDSLRAASELLTRNLDRAQQLILSFKHLSASQLSNDRAQVQIDQIIKDCIIVMRSDFERAKVKIEVKIEEGVDYQWDGFPGHLGQVVVNILQNSLRYGFGERRKGNIVIELGRDKIRRGEFLLSFSDDGHGVDPEILPRIFEPLVTSGQGKGGTGLGLAISRNIVVNLLGGTICCQSTKDQGATFILTLPEFATGDSERYLYGLSMST